MGGHLKFDHKKHVQQGWPCLFPKRHTPNKPYFSLEKGRLAHLLAISLLLRSADTPLHTYTPARVSPPSEETLSPQSQHCDTSLVSGELRGQSLLQAGQCLELAASPSRQNSQTMGSQN